MQEVLAQITWYHNIALLEKVKDPVQREWYTRATIEYGWSRAVLSHQIDSDLYTRQGRALTNFPATLPAPQSDLAHHLIKDPYNFEFLGLGPNISERQLEAALIDRLKDLSADIREPALIEAVEEIDSETKRKIELAAEDIVVKYEVSRGRECERVGHLKIGFDIPSLAPADPQTGYRDPVTGVRRIEVKGRKKGQPIRLTTNEWYKANQLGDSYWLYVIWDPLENPDAEPIRIQNPSLKLDHVKREVVTARFFEIAAEAVMQATRVHGGAS